MSRLNERLVEIDNLVKRKSEYNSKGFLSKAFAKDKISDEQFCLQLDKLFDQTMIDQIKPDMENTSVKSIISRYTKLYEFLSYSKNEKIIGNLLNVESLEDQVKNLLLNLKHQLEVAHTANQNISNLLNNI